MGAMSIKPGAFPVAQGFEDEAAAREDVWPPRLIPRPAAEMNRMALTAGDLDAWWALRERIDGRPIPLSRTVYLNPASKARPRTADDIDVGHAIVAMKRTDRAR